MPLFRRKPPPRPVGGLPSDKEIVRRLRELCQAYAQDDTTLIEIHEPWAIAIGKDLHFFGGIEAMRRIFDRVGPVPGRR
ncbi:MAG: hypothetical protein ACRDHM_08205, partial [Actinomycetota bacterium]